MKKVLVSLVAIFMVTGIVGCGNSKTAPGEENTQKAEETTKNVETESTENKEDGEYNIVFIPKGVGDFWSIVSGGFEQAAADMGMECSVIYPSKEDAGIQTDTMYDVINSKPDAIVLSPVNADPLVAPCQEAEKAGIPVVLVDTLIATEDYVNAFMTDNVAAGALAAEEMAKLMENEGKVHLFAGSAGSTANVDRLKGFTDYMEANCPDIEIIGTLYSEADVNLCTTQATDVMAANPDLKAVFAVDEMRTSGVGMALLQQGKAGDIIVGGFDANDDTVALMEQGVVNFLTIQQPYQMGYQAFNAALETVKGTIPEHEIVDTGCTIVRREEMDKEEMQKMLFPLKFIGE